VCDVCDLDPIIGPSNAWDPSVLSDAVWFSEKVATISNKKNQFQQDASIFFKKIK